MLAPMSRARTRPRTASPDPFDAAYYARFYENARTRVARPEDTARLARFVWGYLEHLGVRPKSALDLGCGLGWWRDALRTLAPSLRYRGVERSAHLCEKLGWEHGSVVDYAGAGADLVICQGVLHYLDRREALGAIATLARTAKKALYLEVLTKEDWAHHVDRTRTDGSMSLRPARFYRQALAPHFVPCGGGLYLPHASPAVLFELEKGR
ncbi:MAG: class I SAM-dependent methyltransferase [Sandaracinaceae bacterium]